jgi:NAD(P)-dependent dehydrogenase (short-subunit alcohol dehydrogenase family)
MNGKICMVTGATSGIGAATAEGLAQRGATLILVGRNREKCEATADQFRSRTGNSSIECLVADLSSQADIRGLARQFRDKHSRLDVLINNAGGIFMTRRQTVDGLEMTFALNHLAYFLLTTLLLDSLEASAPSRIINVSSCGHERADGIVFDDLQSERGYRGFKAYHRSKLANLLFTYELARRLSGTDVTVNALGPGVVATNIGRNNRWIWRILKPLVDVLFRMNYISPEEGARTAIHLAASPDVDGLTGLYFAKEEPTASSEASRDEATARRLWKVSEELTSGSVYAGQPI